MWLSRFLLAFLLLTAYVGLRLRKLFVRAVTKNLFTAFYLLLVLAFPVAEALAHSSSLAWARYFLLGGYYALPYLLYLSLAVILFDLLLGAGRLLKIFLPQAVAGRRFHAVYLGMLFFLPLAVVVWGSLNYSHIHISKYHIEIPGKSSVLTHLRIALVADFHLREMTSKRLMPACVAKINSLSPDLVLIPGDVLEGDRRDEQTAEFERQFRQLRATYGVFASPGNHEAHGGGLKTDFFNQAGIRLLQDELVKIDQAFCLAGRSDGRRERRKPLEELLANASPDLPLVLLDHRPIGLEQVSRSRVDIQVSAHTHHGQLFPFNFITSWQYELSWGYKKIGQTHFFVTCGVQGWGSAVRTAGVSEIMLIDVVFAKDGDG